MGHYKSWNGLNYRESSFVYLKVALLYAVQRLHTDGSVWNTLSLLECNFQCYAPSDRRSPSFLRTHRLRLQGIDTHYTVSQLWRHDVNTCVYRHEKLKSQHMNIVVCLRVCVCVCVCVQCSKVANITLCSAWPHINSNLNKKCTPMAGFEIVKVLTSCSLVNMCWYFTETWRLHQPGTSVSTPGCTVYVMTGSLCTSEK